MPADDAWTPGLLKEHFDRRFESADRAVAAALAAQEKLVAAALTAADAAGRKAELSSDKRFDAVNEFRSVLSDQQRVLLPRAEAQAEFKGLQDRIDALCTRVDLLAKHIDRAEGKGTGISALGGWIVGGIGLLGTLVALYFAFNR